MNRRLLVMALALVAVAGCGPHPTTKPAPAPLFTEEAAASGLDFTHRSGARQALNIVQTAGGGCGVLDYDGDGWLDLFLVQGAHQPGVGGGNRLYRNLHNGGFEDVTEKAGVRGRGYGMGCAAGDYDGDGRTDLFVANYGTSELYRNRGDGTFEEIGRRVGAAVPGCSVGGVFADFDGDGKTDLYVVRYVDVRPGARLVCSQVGVPTTCDPQSYPPEAGVFLRNNGARFEDRTRAAGLVNDGRGMAAVAADLNEDGHLDLLVTNDTTANALFLGDGKGHFRDESLTAGVAYGEMGAAEANMGCDAGDYDGDGRVDLAIGVLQDRSTLLFRNAGQGLFTLESRGARLSALTSPWITWGIGFLDADLDGDLDLFQANGHINSRAGEIDPTRRFAQPRQLLLNDGAGHFIEGEEPAMRPEAAGRGAAFGDLDNDGDVDVVVNNLDGPPVLLRSQAQQLGRHWLKVRLRGPAAEGARLTLQTSSRTQSRIAHAAYSYASTSDPAVCFGLGAETGGGTLEVRVPGRPVKRVPVESLDRELTVSVP